ncbi:zinc ribbon domain-containing protein [uncultured Ruminococcus sp.]|uniref:zinc ribbon domain-containing protein n=1 Tax=uncultured Ruminococcus sp. TaxID=165186 RepID=UPI00261B9D5B|nr:zinc ribbon domain-containing protein [uncultured Ruminococcus sp.]
MRLIDADELMKYPIRINHYDKEHGNEDFVLGIESVLEYAENLPTIEAEPVNHGWWLTWEDKYPGKIPKKKNNLGVFCSECRLHADNKSAFCPQCGARMDLPNCGAKMDGGKENGAN